MFVIHTAFPLVAALDIHLTLLLANTFIGTFVIHATFPLVATLDIHLTLLLGDAFAGLCAPASLKSTLRQNQGIPAFARLSIGALARRPLIILISRVFLRRVEIAVLVFTAFVAHKFSGIVSVTSPFASLTMGEIIPVVHLWLLSAFYAIYFCLMACYTLVIKIHFDVRILFMDTTTCPHCGATLFVEDSTEEYIICEYCGTRVYFHYDRNFQNGFEDYARRYRQAERSRKAHIRKRAFQNAVSSFMKRPYLYLAGTAVILSLAIGLGIWIPQENKRRTEQTQELIASSHLAQGEVQIPEIPCLKRNISEIKLDLIDYRIVEHAFVNAGFTNVTTRTQESTSDWNNMTYEGTIDGASKLPVGEWYPHDTPIVISYYTYGVDGSSSSVPTTWDDIANNAINRINNLADSTYQDLDSLAEQYDVSVSRPRG